MPMPGAGDPYIYEWYVGLENVIKMLNPDSGIRCVVFQHDDYNTIDDVVVEYTNGSVQMCYQVKHNVETAVPQSLTFGNMLESSGNKRCLFEAMFWGWKDASAKSGVVITPVLFTNRIIHNRRVKRHIDGKPYSAYAIDQFISKIQDVIADTEPGASMVFCDDDLDCQWKELRSILPEVELEELKSFVNKLQIKGNERTLKEMKHSLLSALGLVFSCNENIAEELFSRLLNGLTEWTTTGRTSREVTIEDVYSVLGIGEDSDDNQHRLVHPCPFFESRRSFCDAIVKQMEKTPHKVVFISGNPGSGKTSTISFLQSEYNLFLLRYHTFRPISPEQHFYNADTGVCTAEELWGTLLIQLRKRLSGRLAELQVPVSNKLLSIEEKRRHVMRLLGILGKEACATGKKEYICIDGIDHAARANIPVTFLNSLPLPCEIPEGICFVLAGQPATMYQDQYPQWLSNGTNIEYISMPKLNVSDIKQLIASRAKRFENAADELADLIFQKTEGNNLSAVFAVEEINALDSLEDVVSKLQQSFIGGDIQQYYTYIWTHMKAELSKTMMKTYCPESIVACPILLMNGRVNTRILATALNYGMDQSEWSMLLDQLFPLVVRINDDGEYGLFHNDFRVFLMGVVRSYQARYQSIALSLAEYFLQNDEGILSYIMGIPLLQCAEKCELIPKYFTTEFVINALAEGVSHTRLDDYVHLSYDAACKNRDYVGYRNTYLAVKTLDQHKKYYDYYGNEYKTKDYPEISTIDIAEIRALPINNENLNEYDRALSLCEKLYSSDKEEHKERALRLYDKWFSKCSPVSIVQRCVDTSPEESSWEIRPIEVVYLLQHWGKVAAKINALIPPVNKELSDREWNAVLSFGEQYFSYCIQHKKYDSAINAMKSYYVSKAVFSEKLEDIYYAGAAWNFIDMLTRVEQNPENPTWNLLARSMIVTCDPTYQPKRFDIDSVPAVQHIIDQTSFTLVLKAFLLGCIEKDKDDEALVKITDEYCAGIKDEKAQIGQAKMLARVAVLLGKYYWVDNPRSTMLEGCAIWLLSASLSRSIDYSKARRFLLYTLLNSVAVQTFGGTESFVDALQVYLFEVGPLGRAHKTTILDYLVKQKNFAIIKRFINALYGKDCSNICLEEQKADMHERFRTYGELVEPELMQQFSQQLKWDVVGYSGYKEYALYAPLDCFEVISKNNPFRWNDLGIQLYNQSVFAEQYDNRAAYDIDVCITEAATRCGIADYWELRKWDDEFRLKPDQIKAALLGFARSASSQEELQVIWILCCGIHSWYTYSERISAKDIYDSCIFRAQEIDADFASFVLQVTPQWYSILDHLSEDTKDLEEDNAAQAIRKKEQEELSTLYKNLSVAEAIDHLKTVEQTRWASNHYAAVLERILTSNENTQDHLRLFLHSFSIYLQGKEWTYERYDSMISTILSELGWDAFWAFAETIGTQLSDQSYQTSVRNMQLLLKLMNLDDYVGMEKLFKAELHTQQTWISGNNHFCINNEHERTKSPFANVPNSFAEMALYTLLEQVEAQNARKLEAAIYAIYLLGAQFRAIIFTIAKLWEALSKAQEECLLIVLAKWAAEGTWPKELCGFVMNIYNKCSELPSKYYLHSILLKLEAPVIEVDTISYTAPAIRIELSENDVAVEKNCYSSFLSLIEQYKGKREGDKLRRCLAAFSPVEHFVEDRFEKYGDFRYPIFSAVPGEIFYGKDKRGEWATIPLAYKKAHLISPEDPFLLTEMPQMVFDSTWFPDTTSTYDGNGTSELAASDLKHIAHFNIGDDEIVLAASLWYPFGDRSGAVYVESSKIDLPIKNQRPITFDFCVGNYGLLMSEAGLEESWFTTIGEGGLSLFKRVCGSVRLYFGNCQLAPSSVWGILLNCKPKDNNPYKWVNSSGVEVLRFERFAAPKREMMRGPYIRQPILFRWVCKATWLENELQRKGLCLFPFELIETYPTCGDE